jgi:hypothetical protein
VAFSFDSFLDLVANVVGVIIRLILVVWVGARSYNYLPTISHEDETVELAAESDPPFEDPLQGELTKEKEELARAEKALLEQLRQLREEEKQAGNLSGRLDGLVKDRQAAKAQQQDLAKDVKQLRRHVDQASLTLDEARQRCTKLLEEIAALRKLPPPQHSLRYRTPVSRPVDAEEIMFECKSGRVTLVDINPMLEEIRRGLEEKGQALRHKWQIEDVTGPVGPFQLRYVVERQREPLDEAVDTGSPSANSNFSFGLTGWQVEPITSDRGETLRQAFDDSSEFRQVIESIDPHQTVVTFWVYPDSFAMYRKLRDYLYDRNIIVAGRPLPEGVPISSSKHGTASRGQ